MQENSFCEFKLASNASVNATREKRKTVGEEDYFFRFDFLFHFQPISVLKYYGSTSP